MVKEIEEIIDAGIEPRLAALIYRAGYRREDLATLTQEDIMKIRGVGKKKAEDILSVIKEGVNTQNEKSTDLEYEGLMASNKLKEYFYEYVAGNDCDLYTLKPLSIYSINTFLDNDFRTFNDVVKLTEIQIAEFDSKHRTINEELEKARAYYFSAHKNNIIKFINNLDGNVINEEKTPTSAKELLNWIAVNGYQDEFKEYLEYTDIDILALGLSNRLINSLKTNGLFNLSDLIQINPEKVANFKQLGKAGYREYLECRESFLNRNINEITNFCKGTDKRIKYDYYQTRILDSLSKKTNACQFDDIAEEFPELNEEELQDCLDSLKKKKRIRINRNGISYALPSFVDIVYRLPEGNRQTILVQRLSGKTLEEVGKSFGLTRERIRQLENKGIADAVNLNLKLNHTDRFKENEYVEIYERYNMLGEDFRECFGLSIVEYYAVVLLSRKKGSKAFDESILDDETISKQLKAKIQKFLDKDVIKIKGERIPIRKAEIRTYVIERYCKKEVTIEDFVKLHNDFLDSHKLGERKDLLIDEEQSRTMENQISLRNDVLWKQGAKFRHYDIYARDYTELFADLDLPSYENIQISTEKLIKENKKLVKKYDIHDEYELHNLIKKIYSTPELFEQYKVYFGEESQGFCLFSFKRVRV